MPKVVSPPHTSLQERATYGRANLDLPTLTTGCLCPVPSSWWLSGHQQVLPSPWSRSTSLLPSHPLPPKHTQPEHKACCLQELFWPPPPASTAFLLLQWLPAPASSHKRQNPLHHLSQGSNPSKARPGHDSPSSSCLGKGGDGGEVGKEKTRANPFASDFKVISSRSLRNSLSTK